MRDFIVGQAVPVAGERVVVRRILAPNAGPMTGPGTNSYLIGERQLALIDPGPAIDSHVEHLLAALQGRELRWILVTHTHGDHSPAAAVLQQRTGAALVGLAPASLEHNDQTFRPQRLFAGGEVLDCEEYRLEFIHTPGHVSNHLCYLIQDEGILFTGDHILQGTTSVILPPDGDMADYMDSLNRLLAFPLKALAPGHGDIITNPQEAIDKLLRHRLRREQKVVNALRRDTTQTLDALVLIVYDDVASHLIPWARRTLLAHLLKLQREGRARESAAGWSLTEG